MPRKTRRKKIAAHIRSTNPTVTSPIHEVVTSQSVAYTLTPEEVKQKHYFMIDLRKSLVVTGIIFAIEIFLYILSINNYLSKVLKF